VRCGFVVVAFELVQYERGVSSVEDKESVEEFAADCPDEAFGDRVRAGCPHRGLDDPDVDGGEDGVEGGGEGDHSRKVAAMSQALSTPDTSARQPGWRDLGVRKRSL